MPWRVTLRIPSTARISQQLAALATVVVVGSAAGAIPQNAAEALARAEAAMAASPPKLEEAVREADEAIAANAELWPAYLVRGVALGQLGRQAEALESFVRATDLSPGQPAAHRAVVIAAFNTQDYELAWDHLVRAIQAGDTQAVDFIEAMKGATAAPADLDARLEAPKIFVEGLEMDTLQTGVDLEEIGDISRRDPRMRERPDNTNEVELVEVLRQIKAGLAESRSFGLTPLRDEARYSMVIEIHEIGGGVSVTGDLAAPSSGGPRYVKGYLKIREMRTGDEVYSRLLDLGNVGSVGDIHSDIVRHMAFLEDWVKNQGG